MSDIKLKVIPQFPTQVEDGKGVDLTKSGNWMFSLSYADFPYDPNFVPDTNHYVLMFDYKTGNYFLIPSIYF